jgi:hypothetical protein
MLQGGVVGSRPSATPVVSSAVAGGAFPLRFALVVGFNCYRYARSGTFLLPELRYATQDAIDLTGFLRDLGFEVTQLFDADATYDAV